MQLRFIFSIFFCFGSIYGLIDPKHEDNNIFNDGASTPVDISRLLNNRAFAASPNDANMDGIGGGYPAEYLPNSTFVYNGVNFSFPQYKTSGNDNVLLSGQSLNVTRGKYFGAYIFAAAEDSMATGNINATYSDGSVTSSQVLVPQWWSWPYPFGGDIVFPYYLTNNSVDYNRSMIYQRTVWIDSTKDLVSLQLPDASGGGLHLFALSLWASTSNTTAVALEVQHARSTQLWLTGSDKVQAIEVLVNNAGAAWISGSNHVQLTIVSDGLKTVQPGIIKRLHPGDQARVVIGVVNNDGISAGSQGPATVVISGPGIKVNHTFEATFGIQQYETSFESIYTHESPYWYNDGKYGIFIHWGLYAVPGWGNVGADEEYAEWYWWYMNAGPDTSVKTFEYNLQTYGPNHVYDDFIQNFTADAWDPKEWVDLFADAGANYFVQVTKHHEGYALFDLPANVSLRTSVAQFPHRNLLQELFDAAREYQPQLHLGTYYSIPEWFNPSYAKYGFSMWPGGNATNPYTNQTLPYIGYVETSDYLTDTLLPSMLTLASMGTEIMWCDIGGPNMTLEFATTWYNNASLENRQVIMDNRCGLPGDFDTPEYATYNAAQPRKWESNLGMDPFSYGYNRATPVSAYMNASTIVTSLIDIISKNGNLLLDVGPTANGTIIQVEQDHLREAGAWIKGHAEAVYNTSIWFVTPGEGDLRFVQTVDAFYIHSLVKPVGSVVVESPVPFVDGDKIQVVGGMAANTTVPAQLLANGTLVIEVSEEVADGDEFVWTFKIPYT